MAIADTRKVLRRIFFQRCFYFFVLLLALIAIGPFLEPLSHGGFFLSAINSFLIVSAVAAVGRSVVSFVIATVLAAPALYFHWLMAETGDLRYQDFGLRCDLALYGVTIFFLMRYVDRGVMTSDRLSGAASAFLLIGVMWTFIFVIIMRADPNAFSVGGSRGPMPFMDMLYYSFTTLTTLGYGDIVPVSRAARTAALLEAIIGQLFIAILIAKLVGVYARPTESRGQMDVGRAAIYAMYTKRILRTQRWASSTSTTTCMNRSAKRARYRVVRSMLRRLSGSRWACSAS